MTPVCPYCGEPVRTPAPVLGGRRLHDRCADIVLHTAAPTAGGASDETVWADWPATPEE